MELFHAMPAQAMAMNADTGRTLLESVGDRVRPYLMNKTTALIVLVPLRNRRCGLCPPRLKNKSQRVTVGFW